MKRNSRKLLLAAVLAAFCFICATGCSTISKIKESISGEKFSDIATEYGLEVENRTADTLNTYIAQGNGIYIEFYIFGEETYINTSYDYLTGNIEAAFAEDESAKKKSSEGSSPRFQMSNSSQNAVVSRIGNTMIYAYATESDGIDNVDEFLEKIGY